MTDNDAIARCREALDSDDMLAVATRDDFSELLAEHDKLRGLLREVIEFIGDDENFGMLTCEIELVRKLQEAVK